MPNKHRNPITKHHIVPRSRWGSSHKNNIAAVKEKTHVALHTLLENKLPHEQIEWILTLAWSTLTAQFKRQIYNALSAPIDQIYKHECFIKTWREAGE